MNKIKYIIPIFIFIIVFLLVTELLRSKIFFSVFVGFPAGIIVAFISALIVKYRWKNEK